MSKFGKICAKFGTAVIEGVALATTVFVAVKTYHGIEKGTAWIGDKCEKGVEAGKSWLANRNTPTPEPTPAPEAPTTE